MLLVRAHAGKFPVRVVAYDPKGRRIQVVTIKGPAGRAGPRPIASTWRTLIRAKAEPGPEAILRVARSTGGGECVDVTIGNGGGASGCYPEGSPRTPLQLGIQNTRLASFVHGRVAPNVSSLELHYRDGATTTATPVEDHVLSAVPSRQARDGHRLTHVVGRDARGREVARQDFPGARR